MAAPRPSRPHRRTWVTLLVGTVLLFCIPLLGTAINKAIQPQRHAEAARCLSVGAGGSAFNACDAAVIAAYCHRTETQDRNDDPCQMQRLEAGEVFTGYTAAPAAEAPYYMACEAPFVPKWGPSLSNAAIQQKRCARPEAAPKP